MVAEINIIKFIKTNKESFHYFQLLKIIIHMTSTFWVALDQDRYLKINPLKESISEVEIFKAE